MKLQLKSKRNGPVELVSTRIAARMAGISIARLKQLEDGELKGILRPIRIMDGLRGLRAYSREDIDTVIQYYKQKDRAPLVTRQKD